MADARSPHYDLPIPDEGNLTSEEFVRIRNMVLALESVVHGLDTALGGKAAEGHDHVIAGVQGLHDELTALSNAITALQSPTLASLEDVNVSSAVDGQVLLFIGSTWQAAKIASANVTYGGSGSVEGQLDSISVSLSGKASTVHTHTIENVTGLQSALDGKASAADLAGKANSSHSHAISQVTGLQSALDGKLATGGKAADSDKLDGLNSSQLVRSDGNDTMSGSYTIAGNLTVHTNIYVGKNGGGDSWAFFYDDNSNTWRNLGWDDSQNAFGAEENDGGFHKLAFCDTQTSASATNFPIGHVLVASFQGGTNRNASRSIYLYTGNSQQYVDSTHSSGKGSILAGTYRARGVASGGETYIYQRVA
ncbi:hypothetical protein [Labrenzia sp. OB1]|uniref:hypothetical protein n=1 Tax=Labrenzia sp. OB1 TaxID=1561204 RepID=UPI0007B25C82|nr:hypothetical protein [Labrenzia sp. OB1]KZM48254.1 hypothetical protein OA90_21075 [Labrenzia sp. OB1]